ncbi:A/G-specific adenine glycosylase [Planctomycetota bacterium]|nr:A/G-specific adenine glycosylase [Planctomycetota bacterium]
MIKPHSKTISAIRSRLLAWYDQNARDLPWRTPPYLSEIDRQSQATNLPGAYHTLVSEAMLQQTQVATVIPYFHRFLDTFPTLKSLAQADEQQVLTLWQGLGYYRRARNLHACANVIMSEHQGQIPHTVDELLKLPGIGQYTAGAIASIAFNQPAPILDGNVIRILSRIFFITDPTDHTPIKKQLWSLAEQLVPETSGRPGDYNQSMMELGALICSPRNPNCNTCPLQKLCKAYADGSPESLPITLPKSKPRPVHHHILAIQHPSKPNTYFFEQRPSTGLWSNMYQLPTLELNHNKDFESDQLITYIQKHLKIKTKNITQLKTFKHQTTHLTITFHLHAITPTSIPTKLKPNTAWRSLTKLTDLPLSNPQQQATKCLSVQ